MFVVNEKQILMFKSEDLNISVGRAGELYSPRPTGDDSIDVSNCTYGP